MPGSMPVNAASVDYSVVVPVFNEAPVLHMFYDRLVRSMVSVDGTWELVFVNDGSLDDSLSILKEIQRTDPGVRVITLSRNFGHQVAITAGIDHCRGNAVIVLDADLQDPPELIPQMIMKAKEGVEVVYAVRDRREGESVFKRWSASLFYRSLGRLTDVAIPLDVGDYRLVGGKALAALRGMREQHRFVRGMVSWIGFRQAGIRYARASRAAGRTKYPVSRMIRLGLDALTSFSFVPLKLASYLGFFAAFLSFGLIAYVVYLRLFTPGLVPGWASQIVAILFLGGVQLISLGILGEYIGRIYDEVRARPLYVVDETLESGGGRSTASAATAGGAGS